MNVEIVDPQEATRNISKTQEQQVDDPPNSDLQPQIEDSPDGIMVEATGDDSLKLTFKTKIAQYRKKLDSDFDHFVAQRAGSDQDDELERMDWDELESRYSTEMGMQIAAERDIMNEMSQRFQQFSLWTQVSNEKEADRALKRLRTRIAFVHNSEEELATKQEHYAKVLSAFQDAMALLSNL